MAGSWVRQLQDRVERFLKTIRQSEGSVLIRRALAGLEPHLPLVVAGAFVVIALGVAASVSAADTGRLVVTTAADQVPGPAAVGSSPQVAYPVWSGRPGRGEVAATGTLEVKNGQLVLSSANGDIVLTAPDGKSLGTVTAVGPWTVSGGHLQITVRELLPYQVYPLPLAGASGGAPQ